MLCSHCLSLLLILAFLCTSVTAFAKTDTSVGIDLLNREAQSFNIDWDGKQGTVTVSEALPAGPQPRFDYNLNEGVGTWTRNIYYTIGIWTLSYTVKYTINSNYRVTIHDLYDFGDMAILVGVEHTEAKIVNSTETSTSPAECFSTWRVTVSSNGLSAGQTVTVRCKFKDSVLHVSLG